MISSSRLRSSAVELAVFAVFEQRVLLGHEFLDVFAYLRVVHGRNPLRVSEPAGSG